jgi:ATP-dependent Zn protease
MQKWVAELIVAWLPFIFMIGVWFWLSRRGSFGASAKVVQLYEQQIDETRRTNVLLERIAISLENRRTPQ